MDSNNFVLVAGSKDNNQLGVYGVLGQPSSEGVSSRLALLVWD
jgi:hypothetical protein